MTEQWMEGSNPGDNELHAQRQKMVNQQIERRGIRDPRIIEAMRTVPRHLFVPEKDIDVAYKDCPVAIGFEQTISQPYIVAYMLELLKLKGIEKVLEIGSGSGYGAALLSFLCDEIYSVEIIPELSQRSEEVLRSEGYLNVKVRCTDGYKGWTEEAPFDRIILSAAPSHIPSMLVEQLAPGGQLILPLGDTEQRIITLTKDQDGHMKRTQFVRVKFVPMTGIISSVN